MADSLVINNLRTVVENLEAACGRRSQDIADICPKPRLVAVAKTKPKDVILEAYSGGQRHFGENYVQELHEKAHDEQILKECPDIKWHLIGPVQTNKVKKILEIPNLFIVETVHSQKLAEALQKRLSMIGSQTKLNIFVQVNTSGETAKSGCNPDEVVDLYKYIKDNCPHIAIQGLMTIGVYDYDMSLGPNPDFQVLKKCRDDVCNALSLQLSDVELSMGMSTDYEHAVEQGSTNIRVGSVIFGAREKKK